MRWIVPISFAMESVKICHFKTFRVRNFAWTTLLPFRCFSIHFKMCVLFYCEMSLSDVMFLAHTAILAVSPMSGASTFDTGKKTETGRI